MHHVTVAVTSPIQQCGVPPPDQSNTHCLRLLFGSILRRAKHPPECLFHDEHGGVLVSARRSETLSIVAGLLGLWAVFRASALAAKMYLWSWLLVSLLGQITNILSSFSGYSNIEKFNAAAPTTAIKLKHHWGSIVFIRLMTLIWVVYCFKVCWSLVFNYHSFLEVNSVRKVFNITHVPHSCTRVALCGH